MKTLEIAAGRSARKLSRVQRGGEQHWVGDGFPVRTLFAYSNLGPMISPFLLLDNAGPMEFPSTEKRLGVGEHPHRGFETVPSYIAARWSIGTAPVAAALLVPVMCNG